MEQAYGENADLAPDGLENSMRHSESKLGRKKVGKKVMQSVFGRHSRMGDFDAIVPHLTDEQINGVLAQMRALMSANKRKGR